MGKYYIEQNREGRYLYYQAFQSEKLMLKYSEQFGEHYVDGVAKFELCQINQYSGVRYYIHNFSILSKHSMNGISEEELLCILEQMGRTLIQMGKRKLEAERLIFDPNCIFIDDLTKKIVFILHISDCKANTPGFFEFLYQWIEQVQVNCLQYNIKKCLLSYLSSQSKITYQDFDDYVSNLKEQLFIQKSYSGQQSLSCRLDDCGIQVEEVLEIASPKLATMKMMLDETIQNKAYLVRNTTKERIEITKAEFILGKEEGRVDYVIRGNNAISRIHAKVIYRDGQYYMKDMDSTNHTFVNRRLIKGASESLLSAGMNVMLANESFYFELEEEKAVVGEDILF